jgi:hypothetical protein
VVCTRSPVLPHSPVQPVPALWRVRAKVVIQPGGVVPRLRTRAPVLPHSPVHPVPPPCTRPPVGLPSLVGSVAAPCTRLSFRLLPPSSPVCKELPEPPVCQELPEPHVCQELPEPQSQQFKAVWHRNFTTGVFLTFNFLMNKHPTNTSSRLEGHYVTVCRANSL